MAVEQAASDVAMHKAALKGMRENLEQAKQDKAEAEREGEAALARAFAELIEVLQVQIYDLERNG